jgi:hypothetical protein
MGCTKKTLPSSSASSVPCIDGKGTSKMLSSAKLWKETSQNCARFTLKWTLRRSQRENANAKVIHHKKMPTLSTCAVARKSLVGENEMLVATLSVRNASINSPVGRSNVRIMESMEVVTSHLESGENVYTIFTSSAGCQSPSSNDVNLQYQERDP